VPLSAGSAGRNGIKRRTNDTQRSQRAADARLAALREFAEQLGRVVDALLPPLPQGTVLQDPWWALWINANGSSQKSYVKILLTSGGRNATLPPLPPDNLST